MRWLLFLSRLCLICGVFFLLSLVQLWTQWIGNFDVESTVITIGVFMGLLIIPATLICYLILWLLGKKPASYVPVWLIVANCCAILPIIGYILFQTHQYKQMQL